MHGSFEREKMNPTTAMKKIKNGVVFDSHAVWRKSDNSKPRTKDYTPLRKLKEQVRENVYSF